jgi:capsular polysaccharide transport system permease protein
VPRSPASVAETLRDAGIALYRRRRFGDAAAQFGRWTRQNPGDAVAHFYLGRARLMAGNRPGARRALEEAIGIDAALVRAHLLLAKISLANNNLWQTQSHLQNAIAARRDSATLRARLADIQFRRSRYDAALASAQAALARDPGCSAAARVVAQCRAARPPVPDTGAKPAVVSGAGGVRSYQAPADRGPEIPSAGGGAAAIAIPDFISSIAAVPQIDLLDHLLIVRALILRGLRIRYHDSQIGFFGDFLRPIVVIVAHYYFFLIIDKRLPSNIPIELFVIGGFTVWFAFNYTVSGAINGGRYPAGAVLIPGVTRMHLRLARSAWALLSNLLFCIVSVIPLMLYGDPIGLPDLPLTALIFLLTGLLGFGFGLVMEGLGRVWAIAQPIEKIFTWSLYVTSGLYFSISKTTVLLGEIFWYNPVLHLIEYQRHAFDYGYPVGLVSLYYPAAWGLGLLIAGLMINRCARRLAD